jgi:hypothetical protein
MGLDTADGRRRDLTGWNIAAAFGLLLALRTGLFVDQFVCHDLLLAAFVSNEADGFYLLGSAWPGSMVFDLPFALELCGSVLVLLCGVFLIAWSGAFRTGLEIAPHLSLVG